MSSLGLTSQQVEHLLGQYGLNELPSKKGSNSLKLLLNQFNSVFSYLLLGAAFLAFFIGDPLDGLLILAIFLLNIGLGFWQEYKASRELEALRKLEVLNTRVLRDGAEQRIPASRLVPGDIVILEPGDKIPADGKILQALSLSVNESSLTGESLPVMKSDKAQESSLFFGTSVVSGRGKFLITATGSNTKFGRIALSLSSLEEEKTPLEITLADLGKKLGLIAVTLAVVTLAIRLAQGFSFFEVLFLSVALMVAAVPEGLPAVVTIILALGISKMYRKKTLVRKMVAVESLGAATVICTDKTGTLTKNQMEVTEVLTSQKEELLKCSVLCNSSSLVLKEDNNFDVLGDTTEGSLLVWAKKEGADIDLLRNEGGLVDEIPFSLKKRMMSVVWKRNGKMEYYSKGAPEQIIANSNLSESEKQKWMEDAQKLSIKGLRVIACAKGKPEKLEFLGLIGISDPPRAEAFEAVQKAKQAGIKVVMITGDNELTARTIACQVGLMDEGDEIITGIQLDELSDEELVNRLSKIKVFARSLPEQKLRIIKAYQNMGEVVAVTGDGVNDSLALKQAQIGVSMGITGTDVAKEASDIVLMDDNFASLIVAIEQGRLIYSNISKVVKFLLAGNLSEILLIVGAVILGLPTPLLPAQILWVNFVTDGLPSLALGMDNASVHLMKAPPRGNVKLLDNKFLSFVTLSAVVIGGLTLVVFFFALQMVGLQFARYITFSLVVVSQMTLIFIIRKHHSILSNKYLLLSVAFVLFMQFLIMFFPPLKQLFKL